MSGPESFVSRWSRLKRKTTGETNDRRAEGEPHEARNAVERDEGKQDQRKAPGSPEAGRSPAPQIDPASLPPLDSITADSDVRAFLQAGVPAELTTAALRRAWAADPAIRDFIGIAENQWDFTDPAAMPGFGPLEATDNVRELVAQAMGKLPEVSDPGNSEPPRGGDDAAASASGSGGPPTPQVAGMPTGNESLKQAAAPVEGKNKIISAASQHVDVTAEQSPARGRRVHGGALPQ
jgi:hypothetical protein